MKHPSVVSEPPTVDLLGRPLRNLRLSVTDRCNLRCTYCMPEDDYLWLPHGQILTFDEISTVIDAFVTVGVEKVRLTGGEPLLRKGLCELVEMLASKPAVGDLAMTTNGVLFAKHAADLHAAGLDRVTGWVGPDLLDQLPKVTGRPGSVVYAPLQDTPVEPDVVLLRVNARQLMVLSDALPGLSIQGKPQCHIVALAKEHGVPAASVGCALSRQRTGMGPEEMTCALPATQLDSIVAALEKTSGIDATVGRYAAEDARRFAGLGS